MYGERKETERKLEQKELTKTERKVRKFKRKKVENEGGKEAEKK